MSAPNENVLVVKRSLFDELGSFHGLNFEPQPYLNAMLARGNNYFLARGTAENDPTHKQIIPYAILACGVPLALAQDRASRLSDLKYDLAFTVPAVKTAPIVGRAIVTFLLNDASTPLALDFVQPADHLQSLVVNTHKVEARVQNGHIVIPSHALAKAENTIAIEFTAGNESLNRNDDFMYTLFVPARASLAMPCFDQPDLKARWRLMLTLPPNWTGVSNSRETGRISTSERVGLMFEETQPLSTYLFAFAAGRFSVETAERNGRTFRMFHRETDAAKVARNRRQRGVCRAAVRVGGFDVDGEPDGFRSCAYSIHHRLSPMAELIDRRVEQQGHRPRLISSCTCNFGRNTEIESHHIKQVCGSALEKTRMVCRDDPISITWISVHGTMEILHANAIGAPELERFPERDVTERNEDFDMGVVQGWL
jgi:hypothetical protein